MVARGIGECLFLMELCIKWRVQNSENTNHSDWGNDSCESYSYFDICSYECLEKHQKSYFDTASGTDEYEIALEYVKPK